MLTVTVTSYAAIDATAEGYVAVFIHRGGYRQRRRVYMDLYTQRQLAEPRWCRLFGVPPLGAIGTKGIELVVDDAD